jgi:hypothetical protein
MQALLFDSFAAELGRFAASENQRAMSWSRKASGQRKEPVEF